MRVSGQASRCAGTRLRGKQLGVAFTGVAVAWCLWGVPTLQAQQWRMRISSRVQYVEAQPLVRDSVLASSASVSNGRFVVGDTIVTCPSGEEYCYFYGSGSTLKTYPSVLDADLNVFGLGVEGLRFYVNTRFQTAFGADDNYWPIQPEIGLLNAYAELNRKDYRFRLGRDYNISSFGFYGYDGGSALVRFTPWSTQLELYGGRALARGLPVPVNSSIFDPLGELKPQDDNWLIGFRAAARPTSSASLELNYQRQYTGNGGDAAREQLGLEGSWYVTPAVSLLGHADYDMAYGEFGKAGLKAGWQINPMFYVEGGYLRYRPVFSTQQIWYAFSPVAYNGWNVSAGVLALPNLSFKVWLEQRKYEETGAEVSYFTTTDDDWRMGIRGTWAVNEQWELDGGYWRNHGFGAALNSGDLRVGYQAHEQLSLGARFSAWQQLEEFRVSEGRVWSVGIDARWRTQQGTVWFSIDRYDHDNRGDAAIQDWSQWRSALGFSYYLGSEPGRTP